MTMTAKEFLEAMRRDPEEVFPKTLTKSVLVAEREYLETVYPVSVIVDSKRYLELEDHGVDFILHKVLMQKDVLEYPFAKELPASVEVVTEEGRVLAFRKNFAVRVIRHSGENEDANTGHLNTRIE